MKKSFRIAGRHYWNTRLACNYAYFFDSENIDERNEAFKNISKLHKEFWEGKYNYPDRVNKSTYVIECFGNNLFGEVVQGTEVNLKKYFVAKLKDLQQKTWFQNQCLQVANQILSWQKTISEGRKKLTIEEANMMQMLLEKNYENWHRAGLLYLSNQIRFDA